MTFSILDVFLKGGTVKADMHELSLTQNLLDTALRHSNNRRIVQVNLLIGRLSDEREEAIRFYWDDLSKGTPAEGARLHFRMVEAEMKCLSCDEVFHPEDVVSFCPVCGGRRLTLLSGDDLRLESIDVE